MIKVPFKKKQVGASTTGMAVAVGAAVALLVIGVSSTQIIETLDASEIMVLQDPIDGELHVYTDPGLKWQWFGKVTKYPRRTQYEFTTRGERDTSKKLRFNDGGHANLYGAVSWEMPLAPEKIIAIHKTFGTPEGVEQQAVAKMIDAAVYLAGPLMSSTESSGERRAELVQVINDQAEHGVYVTHAEDVNTKDPITGADKSGVITRIARDKDGQPMRQQGSILEDFSIKLLPLSINELKYDSIVENQIKERQEATTRVQIAVANARRAEQDAITAEKQGQAKAAEAKWTQEVIKAKEVTFAEQQKAVAVLSAQKELEVATLGAKSAEQFKKAETLKGEGEAARKRLVMEADGALQMRLEAAVQMNKDQWNAIATYPGQWVPSVVMGSTGNANSNGAQALIDLLTAQTAKQVGLDALKKLNPTPAASR